MFFGRKKKKEQAKENTVNTVEETAKTAEEVPTADAWDYYKKFEHYFKYADDYKIHHEEAFEYALKAAELGLDSGLFELGEYYRRGDTENKPDKERAFKVFKAGAELGGAITQYHLAECYERGDGVEADKEKALYWYNEVLKNEDNIWDDHAKTRIKEIKASDDPVLAEKLAKKKAKEEEEARRKQKEREEYYNSEEGKRERFRMYLKAAYEGSFFRQYTVGICYRDGIGVEADNKKAFSWFMIAAKNLYEDAMFELGNCYINGIGTDVDHGMAFYWYFKAAMEGQQSEAKYIVKNISPADAISFLDKVCSSKDEELSADAKRLRGYIQFDLYKDDADNGDIGAMKNLGICYEKGIGTDEDLSKALYWYKKAADEGDADCLYFLGMFHKEGTGVEEDEYQAYRYFKAASEKGHLDATYELSHCYEYAYGVDEDIEEAFYLYDHLCQKGYRKAQIAMVFLVMFDSNNFTPEQIDKALYYLEQAGEAGYEDSRGMLFTYYSIGVRPIKKDESKALYWAEKLAEEGEIKYQREAYKRYNEGIGTAVNKQKAMYYLEKAAESGDKYSQIEVCNIYINQKNDKQAFYWLKKLAEGGNEDSYYLLGIRYLYGVGTERSYSEAFYWIKKAAEAGNVEGMEILYKMYRDGVGTEKNMREYRYWKRKWDQNK